MTKKLYMRCFSNAVDENFIAWPHCGKRDQEIQFLVGNHLNLGGTVIRRMETEEDFKALSQTVPLVIQISVHMVSPPTHRTHHLSIEDDPKSQQVSTIQIKIQDLRVTWNSLHHVDNNFS